MNYATAPRPQDSIASRSQVGREREYRARTKASGIALPRQTLQQIEALAERLQPVTRSS